MLCDWFLILSSMFHCSSPSIYCKTRLCKQLYGSSVQKKVVVLTQTRIKAGVDLLWKYESAAVSFCQSHGYFPSHPLASTKLYCLVTEAHVCEELAQGRYMKMEWPGVEPMTSWSRNHYATICCCFNVAFIPLSCKNSFIYSTSFPSSTWQSLR